MKYEILYIHYADRDIVKVIDGFAIKDTLKDLGFTFDADQNAWISQLTEDMHKVLVANGLKMNRFIDKVK